jgi:hypothetical protein
MKYACNEIEVERIEKGREWEGELQRSRRNKCPQKAAGLQAER